MPQDRPNIRSEAPGTPQARPDSWTETDSRDFIDLAEIAVPARDEQTETLLALVPAEREHAFALVDICAGEGLFCERVLQTYPNSRVVALDGSNLMRRRAASRLDAYGDRAQVRAFDLGSDDWTEQLPAPLRCAVSSMALHHLEATSKQKFFRRLAERLEPGGALLIADIIAASNDFARRSYDNQWTDLAQAQSLAVTGSLAAYERALADGWHPTWDTEAEPGEMPYQVFAQLKWLERAGFSSVDCFWKRAGHAVYGGYR
jgi:tRNA (cmo5U34)-methyltransferase